MKKFLLSLVGLTLGLTGFVTHAQETVAYQCLFGEGYNSGKFSSYTNSWSATNNNFTWNIENFNNNNNGWEFIRCGSKNAASTATITTAAPMQKEINKVGITIGATNGTYVTSVKLLTSNSVDFSAPIETLSFTNATGEQTVTLQKPAVNLYYQLVVECTKASSNGPFQLNSIQYYTVDSTGGGTTDPTDPDPNPDDSDEVSQPFITGLGLPEGTSKNLPDLPATATASDTGISYNFTNCYVNNGNYLMLQGKSNISWSLDFACSEIQLTTTSGTGKNGSIAVYADDNLIPNSSLKIDKESYTYSVVIPEEYQKAGTIYKIENTTYSNSQFASFTYVKSTVTTTEKESAGLAFSETTVTVMGKNGVFTAPSLTNNSNGALTWTSSNPNVATVTNQGEVTILNYGTTNITVNSESTDEYYAGTAFYTLNVVTDETLTVAAALALIENGYDDLPANVKGIISEIEEVDTGSYGNATYTIVDALGDKDGLVVYRGYYLNGTKFTATNQLEIGASVEVTGKLVNYNGTYEFANGNKLVSYIPPVKDMYINGTFNEGEVENNKWQLTPGEDDGEENLYRALFEITENELSFNFLYGSQYIVPKDNGEITFSSEGQYNGEFEISDDASSVWTFSGWSFNDLEVLVNLENNTVIFAYTPTPEDGVYIRGAFNNYAPQGAEEWKLSEVEGENGVYSGTFNIPAEQFSFNFEDNNGTIIIPVQAEVTEITFEATNENTATYTDTFDVALYEGDDEFYWTYSAWKGGNCTVTLDLNDGSITISGSLESTVVKAIEKANIEGAIYNLQGVKISNPVKGQIYIVNGKKVVF